MDNSIKNLKISKGIKNFFNKVNKKVVALATTAALLITPLVGCDNNDKKAAVNTDSTVTTTNTTETPSLNSQETTDTALNNNSANSAWNTFEENAWNTVKDKINNPNRDSFDTTLYILNSDYLKATNAQVLYDYFDRSNGIDIEDEMNQSYNVLSQIREYNISLTDSNNFYSFRNLFMTANEKDSKVLSYLEDSAREMLNLSKVENPTQEQIDRVESIFNEVKEFTLGTGKILDVAEVELSKGAIFAAENIMQDISVLSRNYISEERRNEVDLSLNAHNVLSQIEIDWASLSGAADALNPPTSLEGASKVKDMVFNQLGLLSKEVSFMGVTEEESFALYTIANIDYFVKDSNNVAVFNTFMYPSGFDLTNTLHLAESAVSKIEMYNMSVTDSSKLYNYGHYFIESKEDILSVDAIVKEVHTLHVGSENQVEESIKKLLDYSAYASESYITARVAVSDKESTGYEEIKLDKNALNKGGAQVVNWITYYGLLNNKSKIDNQVYSDMMELVDGNTTISAVDDEIALMIDGVCANKNSVVYDYQMGDNAYVYTTQPSTYYSEK